MKKIALVNMPFSAIYRPSIGLGLLKAALVRDGHSVDVYNFNLAFADRVGLDAYSKLADMPSSLIGEWMFTRTLTGSSPYDEQFFSGFVSEDHLELKRQFLEMREQAEPFIDDCYDAAHWNDYDLVGFTSTFEQTTASLSLGRKIKDRNPSVLLALGGANAEGPMGLALLKAYPFIDVVCSGEGDIAFPRFVNALDAGEAAPIPGIMLQGVDTTPSSTASVFNMNSLPEPIYDEYFEQFRATSYGAAEIDKVEIPFESSRGCWWGAKSHCKFCGLNGSNMTFRSKASERLLSELESLRAKYTETQRFFAVDNIIDYKYFNDLLPALRDKDYKLDLFYETKANLSRDNVRLFRDAHITRIQPGIESLSTSILKLMGKGVSALQNIQLLKLCKEFGVQPLWNIIFGFPRENPDEYRRLVGLIPSLTHLTPPINLSLIRLDRFSPYFDESEKYGIVNVRPFDQYGYIHHTLSAEEQFNIAYYFKFDYAEAVEMAPYIRPFSDQISVWKEAHNSDFLFFEEIEGNFYVFNYRRAFQRRLLVLRGMIRDAYEILDKPCKIDALKEALARRGHKVEEADLRTKLAELLAQGLVVEEDDCFLAVAIRLGEYQVPDKVQAAFDQAVGKVRQVQAVAA